MVDFAKIWYKGSRGLGLCVIGSRSSTYAHDWRCGKAKVPEENIV